jgi:hypothetical protein
MAQIDVNDRGVLVTTRDADSAAPAQATRLAFDRYVLDLDRGCLYSTATKFRFDRKPLRS